MSVILSAADVGGDLAGAVARFRLRCASMGMSDIMTEGAIISARQGFTRATGALESPIERILLPWLMFEDYGARIEGPAAVALEEDVALPERDVVIVPQMRFGRYRLDFMIAVRLRDARKMIAVECDGSGYHDASNDKVRDEFFRSWGIETVRADGAKIKRAPQSVSARVADIVIEWAEGLA